MSGPDTLDRAPGACLEGITHEPYAVTFDLVGWVCGRCYVKLRSIQPPGLKPLHVDEHGRVLDPLRASWQPYADDGTPLRSLPTTRRWH